MKSKEFVLNEQTTVKIVKRSSSRQIKLTISSSGEVKVSIPSWMPYKLGLDFAKSKSDWISKQKPEKTLLVNGQSIGKNHHLVFKTTTAKSVTTRLNDIEAIVFLPVEVSIDNQLAQSAANKIAKRALLTQGRALLPIKVKELSQKYGYDFNEIKVKSLKTRWGSCDSNKNITLNLFLMQLPWELIDYVILHELTHTKIMHHGVDFWQAMENSQPGSKDLRKQLKSFKTNI